MQIKKNIYRGSFIKCGSFIAGTFFKSIFWMSNLKVAGDISIETRGTNLREYRF